METKKRAILAVLLLAVLTSTASLAGQGVSAFISMPFPCTPSFALEAPQSYTIYPGGSGEVIAEVSDVHCGITYVSLELENFPAEYYTVEPEVIGSIAPSEAESFTISFDIPENAETKIYTPTYKIRTDDGTYRKGIVEVIIEDLPEKPEEEILPLSGPSIRIPAKEPKESGAWWIIGLTATVLSLLLLISEYFKPRKKPAKTTSKKTVKDILNKYSKMSKKGKK